MLTLYPVPAPQEFQYQVLEPFAAHCYLRWHWRPEAKERYVVPARGAAPYAKRVTLLFEALDYRRMERLLKVCVPGELPRPSRERPITAWQAPLGAGLFAATWQAPGPDGPTPLHLLTRARYVRVMVTTAPLLWTGIVELMFEFPTPFCEATARRGVPQLIEPRQGR